MNPMHSSSLAEQQQALLKALFVRPGTASVETAETQLLAQLDGVSPQTLRRHLREEGTSFQALKDELRRDIAIYHLGRADLSLLEIAEQLGFSEPSAFHRAFKKWTGLTPGAYRAQQS
mgnify:CR=1 FL=1